MSKSPLLTDRNKVSASVGSDDYLETTGDFNKRLGQTSALRVNVMKRNEGSWRSNPATGSEPELHRDGLAASLGLGIGGNDELLFSHLRASTDDKPDYGISFDSTTRLPNTVFPADYYWGVDKNFDESQANMTTATYTHRFSPKSEWRTQLRYADYERGYWARTPSLTVAPGDTGLNLPSTNTGPTRSLDYETVTLQTDFNNKFKALGMTHEFLVGAEYFKEDSFRHSLQNLGGTSAGTPPIYQPFTLSTTGTPVSFKSDSYAVYLQDTVEFMPRWKATLGARPPGTTSPGCASTFASRSYSRACCIPMTPNTR